MNKLSFNWIGLFKILSVGPAPASRITDGQPLHDQLLYFDLPSHRPGRDSKHRVSVLRCKPCRNPTTFTTCPRIFRPTSPSACSTPAPQSPHHSTSRSTTYHHRRNASRSIRSRDINSFAAGELLSPPCTKLVGPTSSALLGNTNRTYCTSGFTYFDIGRAPLRSTARPTAYTARSASGPHTANCRGPGPKYSSRPGTASFHAPSGFTASALQLFQAGHTSDTNPVMASVGRSRPSHLNGQLLSRLLHRPLPRRLWGRPSTVILHHFTERRQRFLVSSASPRRRTGSPCATEC